MWIYFPLLKHYYSYRPNESHEVTVIHKMIKIYPATADFHIGMIISKSIIYQMIQNV